MFCVNVTRATPQPVNAVVFCGSRRSFVRFEKVSAVVIMGKATNATESLNVSINAALIAVILLPFLLLKPVVIGLPLLGMISH